MIQRMKVGSLTMERLTNRRLVLFTQSREFQGVAPIVAGPQLVVIPAGELDAVIAVLETMRDEFEIDQSLAPSSTDTVQ